MLFVVHNIVIAMSTVGEERYVDLKKICDQIDPELFEELSWILLLNLDLVPKDAFEVNPNIRFSYLLMEQRYDQALEIANNIASKDTQLGRYYKELLAKDPKLKKTNEISETFFALAKRRIELIEKLGIYHD